MSRVRTALSAAAAFAAVALASAPASAASVLNVDWGAGCGATNCFTDGRYTHTWSSANATGPIDIGQLLLDRGILGDLDGQVFRLSFQLNGEELGSWGSYMMAGIGGDELNFWGQNFTWNPGDGDLVLVLEIVPPATPGVGGGFRRSGGFASSPLEDGGPVGDGGDEQSSNDTPTNDLPQIDVPSAAPEPASWALMIGGFGLAGATMRRRRAVLRMQPSR